MSLNDCLTASAKTVFRKCKIVEYSLCAISKAKFANKKIRRECSNMYEGTMNGVNLSKVNNNAFTITKSKMTTNAFIKLLS